MLPIDAHQLLLRPERDSGTPIDKTAEPGKIAADSCLLDFELFGDCCVIAACHPQFQDPMFIRAESVEDFWRYIGTGVVEIVAASKLSSPGQFQIAAIFHSRWWIK